MSHTFFEKENRKRRKEKWQKEKNRRCLLQFVVKNNIFQIHQNRTVINVKLNEQENKQGELRQKRETISQDTEKQDKAGKIIVKHVQQERNQTKSWFL